METKKKEQDQLKKLTKQEHEKLLKLFGEKQSMENAIVANVKTAKELREVNDQLIDDMAEKDAVIELTRNKLTKKYGKYVNIEVMSGLIREMTDEEKARIDELEALQKEGMKRV